MRLALDTCYETELGARLENWGRWQRQHLPYSQCNSLEGNYRSPQYGHWERTPNTRQTAYDGLDAFQIEMAVSTIPQLLHVLLGAFYVRQMPAPVAIRFAYREMGEKPPRYLPDFDMLMVKAEDELAYALGQPAVVRMERRRARFRRIMLKDLTEAESQS